MLGITSFLLTLRGYMNVGSIWHLKTRLGTFWVMEDELNACSDDDGDKKYYLGVDDVELAPYTDAEQAARDVYEQATGYFKWDCQSKINVPSDLSKWAQGSPDGWGK